MEEESTTVRPAKEMEFVNTRKGKEKFFLLRRKPNL